MIDKILKQPCPYFDYRGIRIEAKRLGWNYVTMYDYLFIGSIGFKRSC